jgi:stage II sporulation protein D
LIFLIPFDLTKELKVRVLSKYNLKSIIIYSDKNKYHVEIFGKEKIKVNGRIKSNFFVSSEKGILVKGKGIERKYRGKIEIYNLNCELFIINHVNLRDYLASLIVSELGSSFFEALKAQAVLSRTFALFSKRHEDYDFCDLTHCQVYKGSNYETSISRRAVLETDGEVLFYEGKIIEPFYSSSCGGITSSPEEILFIKLPYLESKRDPFCKGYKWIYKIKKSEIGDLKIIQRGESGRVKLVFLNGREISGWDFRNMISREKGWNTLKSNLFDLYEDEFFYIFEGKGLGHGLGMCQEGACNMALKGFNYKEIINFYFKDIEIKKLKFEYEVLKDENFVFYSSSGEKYFEILKNAFYRFKKLCEDYGIEINKNFVIKEEISFSNFTKNLKIKPFYAGYLEKDTIKIAPLCILEKYGIIEEVIIHELFHALLKDYKLNREIEEGIIYLISPYNLRNEKFEGVKIYEEEILKIEKYKNLIIDSLKKYGNLKNFLITR